MNETRYAREGGMSGRLIYLVEHATGATYYFSHWAQDGTPVLVPTTNSLKAPEGAHLHVVPESWDHNAARLNEWAATQNGHWRAIGQLRPGLNPEADAMQHKLKEIIEYAAECEDSLGLSTKVETFRQAGMLTTDSGLVITTADGQRWALAITKC